MTGNDIVVESPPVEPSLAAERPRISGYDLARALAVLGMVIVNFNVVMVTPDAGDAHVNVAGASSSGWLAWAIGLLEGRAAATFVVLAGVGLSLLSRTGREAKDRARIGSDRLTLLRRAAFLFFVGLAYTALWPADILHFYGLYIAVGALLLTASSRVLWIVVAAVMLGFVGLNCFIDYDNGWDWATLEYVDFWTVPGMLRHMIYNGFHPVLPWVAFLIAGMWLGRQPIWQRTVRRCILIGAAAVAVFAEALSWLFERLVTRMPPGPDAEDMLALVDTAPMPPMPLYLLAAGGTAFAVVAVCVTVMERFPNARWTRPLVATGQLALTMYVAHVVIGMGTLEELGMLDGQSVEFALGTAVMFYVLGVAFCALWRRKFKRGPLEWVMRKVT